MTQYLLSIYRDDKTLSEEEFQQSYVDVNALADELTAAGSLVFAGGLNRTAPTVVRSVDGKIVTTDGPFAESKEQLGGFWIVEADDVDAARDSAAKLAAACRRPIEVCPFEQEDATVDELFSHTADPAA
jgi:hypothetical protein